MKSWSLTSMKTNSVLEILKTQWLSQNWKQVKRVKFFGKVQAMRNLTLVIQMFVWSPMLVNYCSLNMVITLFSVLAELNTLNQVKFQPDWITPEKARISLSKRPLKRLPSCWTFRQFVLKILILSISWELFYMTARLITLNWMLMPISFYLETNESN